MQRSLRGMNRGLRGLLAVAATQQGLPGQQVQQQVALRAFAAAAEPVSKDNPFYNVPAGHINSDLSDTVCNIGLNRLRDLTMRQDLRLTSAAEGTPFALKDLFKGKRVVLFGVPDMAKVCSEQHVPSFEKVADELKALGVHQVYALAVAKPEAAREWAAKTMPSSKVAALVDTNGGFTRMLGVEFGEPASPAKSQRYAALIDDGILLRLRVEKSPADMNLSSGDAMVSLIKEYFATH